MSENKSLSAAVLAAGAVALAALIGCGGEESVASKSAAAFEEAQKRGETFGGEGHAHGGHEAETTGGEHGEAVPRHPAAGEEGHAGHGAAAPEAGGMQHGTGHEGMDHAAQGAARGAGPADHSAMGHGAGAPSGGHAGHGAPAAQAPAGGHAGHGSPAAQAPAGHAGHSAAGGETPSRPVAELPAQPAGILRPDAVDAPAATSVMDAQRSKEMNQAMSGEGGGHGGHGGHGAGTYRQTDAGRGPGAHEGSEPRTPGAGPQQHDHGAAPGEKEREQAAVYACPMHPEVTSKTPGTCPKCGMALVERREE